MMAFLSSPQLFFGKAKTKKGMNDQKERILRKRIHLSRHCTTFSIYLKEMVTTSSDATSQENSALDKVLSDFDKYVVKTYNRQPLYFSHGNGAWLWDQDERKLLDFVGGIATCSVGHCHPKLIDAVQQQMNSVHHVSNLYYIPQQVELAKWLVEHSCADKVFFCNSGTEANEAAIKLARKYGKVRWNCKEPIIISANKSFHGRTCGSLSATAQPKYQSHFLPLLPGFLYVDYNDTSSFLELVDNIKSSDDRRIVGVMLEAVQGEGGVMPGDEKFFQTVRQVCSQIGALMILDEVQVGMGRTGRLWGYEHYRIEPDIFTTAKGLAGGVPIGAMLCQSHCDLFEPGDHAATFGGNPLSCVAALSVCHIIEEEQLIENAKERGMELQIGLEKLKQSYPQCISQVRGLGLLIGLQLKDGYTASQVIDRALEQNLLVLSAGPQVVRLAPPLVITQEQVQLALHILNNVFKELI
ncbi:acetylornithine aminotransferase [Galdieria sulphuraria]|uniref:acetylornithine transaminase n=1 Tax=Galdieria sulphuraria TaxID=130081 RepID=M2X564_GALSU|nr:acetylornithine aminotransferase [Galdieria sulphuraria]XP_005708145.1 acetylornithine aminotransferase [Galdieria sulphuraria]EME26054.1 acetylornithine aminotransferase [Galdieria sulphuraria]EME31625.1 acetylornithine aminotransferase [Galdieria sulphuraria]|eukprot:XP_005702574.1 acetylornithine aminotransferase [Galdieria sulphuraria]